MISIDGLNKADVLAALYNAARPQGMGFLVYNPAPMTIKEAQSFLDSGQKYFDYLQGRVMKVNLTSSTEFDERLYDRDNGQGAAQAVINELRAGGNVVSVAIQGIHEAGKQEAKAAAEELVNTPTTFEGGTIHLGCDSSLSEALKKAIKEKA